MPLPVCRGPIRDRETLHAVLVEIESDKAEQPITLLRARMEVPPNVSASSLLNELTEVLFEQSERPIRLRDCEVSSSPNLRPRPCS
jgi:hypothetical protein